VRRALRDQAARLTTDALGNLLVHRPAQTTAKRPLRVLLAAHLDEVGFMLTHPAGEGLYRVQPIGGLTAATALGQAVWVGPQRLPGVIGAAPVHLQRGTPRLPTWDDLRLDVGPRTSVEPGQRATFATPFRREGNTIFAKALDDRVGVVTLMELIHQAPPHVDLWAAFTVQEEVGLRGARVVAHAVNPDVAFALDCTPARDLPGPDGRLDPGFNTRLGHGPAIYTADRATLSDPRLIQHLLETAEAEGLPYQFRQAGGGGTDAGAIHKQRGGIPTVSVSTPARYLHSAASLARFDDWKHTFYLLLAALHRLTPEIRRA
jgi:endoglucanase